MRRTSRRRPTGPRRATFAAVALILGGGGLVGADVYASATEGGGGGQAAPGPDTAQGWGAQGTTIDCPDVGARLTSVPDAARATVDGQLAALDQQIATAYRRLRSTARPGQWPDDSGQETITAPLKERRSATIERIADAIGRAGDRPQGLQALAACTLRPPTAQDRGGTGRAMEHDGGGGQEGDGGRQRAPQGRQQGENGDGPGNGPVAADYADIASVRPNTPHTPNEAGASRGSFASSCGVNANGLFNSDNVIVAPGVANGAHHFHDYVGNQADNAFASDEALANGDTSCADEGDRSTYYWPVLRLRDGTRERDADAPGGGTEGNTGRIVTPKQVTLTFEGNPRGKVTAMPRFLRIITGDAKAFVNGPANANASWSCTGFEDRRLKDKYPLCPAGSDVVRTFRFQSCWDGRNIDSANHRTHVAFAAADGACPDGFRAIPQLVQRIVYGVSAPSLGDGGRTAPLFAVDSFPEQLHKPVTDHGDFINVFDDDLMREMVDCINSGRRCGAGAGQDQGGSAPGEQSRPPRRSPSPQPPQQPPASEPPQRTPSPDVTAPPRGTARRVPSQQPPEAEPSHHSRRSRLPGAGISSAAAEGTAHTASPTATVAGGKGSGGDIGTATRTPAPSADGPAGAGQTEPQAVHGNLAETGVRLWPAAAGAVLVIAGFLLLRRVRHGAG